MLPRAILFDMDGTLTRPMLDFPAIARELGIAGKPILETVEKMNDRDRSAAMKILCRHEDRAAENSTLNDGCESLLSWIAERKIPVAIVTRNSRKSADVTFAKHGLTFEHIISRDDGLFKPDPAPLLVACERLNVQPRDAVMIGDGKFDIAAANAAHIRSVWISHGKEKSFDAQPWKIAQTLNEVREILIEI